MLIASNRQYRLCMAESKHEVRATQVLRTRIYAETFAARLTGLDQDRYDGWCDHLYVEDQASGEVVGTYRLLRSNRLPQGEGFYSEQEFLIDNVKKHYPRLLELGRSCVHPAHRSGAVLSLLWLGIGYYMHIYNIDAVIGCASFPGNNPAVHGRALHYLTHALSAPAAVRPLIRPEYYRPLPDIGKHVGGDNEQPELPALIKGYVRVGCRVGSGFFIDRDCGTIDVCMVLDRCWMTPEYEKRFVSGHVGYAKTGQKLEDV